MPKCVDHYIEKPTTEVIETVVEKKVIEKVFLLGRIEYVEVEKEVPAKLKQFESKVSINKQPG